MDCLAFLSVVELPGSATPQNEITIYAFGAVCGKGLGTKLTNSVLNPLEGKCCVKFLQIDTFTWLNCTKRLGV